MTNRIDIRPNFFKQSTLLASLFIFLSALKLSLAQMLWAPRILTLEDAYYYSAGVHNEWIIVAQIFTIIIFACGFQLSVRALGMSVGFSARYIKAAFFWMAINIVAIISHIISGNIPSLEMFLPIFIPLVVGSAMPEDRNFMIDALYYTLALMLAGGILSAILFPEWAFIMDWESEFSVSDKRYMGLLSHPNQIGAIASLVIITNLIKKFRYQFFVLSIALLSLALSQSKTSILAVLFSSVTWFFAYKIKNRKYTKLLLIVSMFLFLFGWMYVFISGIPGVNEELLSLTGRTQIWEEALIIWKNNIIIGAGQNAFDEDFRIATQLGGATSAHNQVLEVLATIGIAGLLGMLGLIYQLTKAFIDEEHYDQFTSSAMALLVFVFVRGATEPSLLSLNIGSPYFFGVAIFILLSKLNNDPRLLMRQVS